MTTLFSPISIGNLPLSHRIVAGPLTRLRSDQSGDVPGDLVVEYYAQRASEGGLQIAETTPVSVQGQGYLGSPGIYSDAQASGWRRVTDAIHAKGGTHRSSALASRSAKPYRQYRWPNAGCTVGDSDR